MPQTYDVAKYKAPFNEITRKKYADQAVWFLNAFWETEGEKEAENIWKSTQKFIELDEKKKKEGCELDEFQSHKFLETLGETLTVIALREKLREIDLDANGKMALMEYLIFKYKKTVREIVEAPQGGNQEEILAAQAKLEEVQTALAEQVKAQKALEAAEAELKSAEAELTAAVNELKAQEDAYNNKIAELTAKSQDTSGSMVARNKAAAELAQLKGEDPLPLRKAKITQEAALRKVEKQRKAAEVATNTQREKTRETEKKYEEAKAFLEEVKKKGGIAHGNIWWMERELKEAQKYLPKKKQTL